ncbi:hypothetical protein [Streptomyces sp. NPDC001268]|uniref:hypothetical protein n=1 Tax=Streptomyces sp. NPDC001268 TaxID=3364553 RepID=UPI00368D4736
MRDDGEQLANAGSMALTIVLPDGTSTSIAPVAPTSTGIYAHDYTTVQAGRHTVRWVATGINAGAYTDQFDVREATPRGLLSLADAKKHLNIPASSTTDDEELRGWIEATARVVEFFVGPVTRRTVVETHRVGSVHAVALREAPVLEVVSLSPVLTGGTTYAAADFDVDGSSGIVQRLDGSRFTGPLRITYTVGRAVVPANISHAARIILQHLWRTQRGSARGPALAGSDDYSVTEQIPGLGYAVPNRALELLQPDRLPPGVA